MKNPTEKTMADYSEGTMSKVLSEQIRPHIAAMTEASIAKLKAIYRSGPHDLASYMSCAAELAAIEDLQIRLKSSVNRGNRAAEELHAKGN